ncbi:2,3-bisphosphoglycerate-independent phosphoglycerate mutase [Rickettsiella grylli]|uniref:2,3-bisphosphoglycerate-independent phosphoglycerate mutase n=1 Tax=Rickettsiella grylli TaxID=59196 RepID=A8PLN3_9COXI|nr:2,3-bisphosphoglycerate-independent phosphoglycerate mutase [Rickettsiella grylli]
MSQQNPSPLLLLILDGWGFNEKKDHNAIAMAHTPHWDHLLETCPHTLLDASGQAVGLPVGQMGNSEVGHLTLGAGRIIHQDLTRINNAIETRAFFKNSCLLAGFKKILSNHQSVHLIGLLSSGGVHSHENHWTALLELAAQQGIISCYLHPFLDGRDTPPQSAKIFLKRLEAKCTQLGIGKIASLMGRYYAMDRDKRWQRTKIAYDCLTLGKTNYQATNALQALQFAYDRGETDEFVSPTRITEINPSHLTINDGDLVIFMNFRADRARQLSHAFLDKSFNAFHRQLHPRLAGFISLTEYATTLPSQVAFPQQNLRNSLGDYLAQHHLSQLRIAETEKYAHVTFFFNGGNETPLINETRVLIPSKKVSTYDRVPDMSALEITHHLLKVIKEKKYDVIICNFANPDMLGHTGNLPATLHAIQCIDDCIGKITHCLKQYGGEALITADHGNAECMFDENTQQAHTAHTNKPVPFIYVGRPAKINPIKHPSLANIAPTLLYVLNLPKPQEMTGQSLLTLI